MPISQSQVTWSVYQRIIAAYGHPDRRRGKKPITAIIDSLRRGVPTGLEELAQLGRTLWRRRADILAYFDHHASNGPTEAINGRLEALRRNALGFRNLTHYRIPITAALRQPRPTNRCTLIPLARSVPRGRHLQPCSSRRSPPVQLVLNPGTFGLALFRPASWPPPLAGVAEERPAKPKVGVPSRHSRPPSTRRNTSWLEQQPRTAS